MSQIVVPSKKILIDNLDQVKPHLDELSTAGSLVLKGNSYSLAFF